MEEEECPTTTSVKLKALRFRPTSNPNKFCNLIGPFSVAYESMRKERESGETEKAASSAVGAGGVRLRGA